MRNFIVRVILLGVVVMFPVAAMAQHNHDAGHDEYKDWASEKTGNCCSAVDCGNLNSDEVRETPIGPEVKIDEVWCPVKKEHFIIRGKSPDWNKAHACILRNTYYENPCEKLLCYSGKGLW